jgi:hypothetical protein
VKLQRKPETKSNGHLPQKALAHPEDGLQKHSWRFSFKEAGGKIPETYHLEKKQQQQHVYPCMIMELIKIKSRYI